ncbi:VIP36-like protein [Brachionichthys hirsutus]|uniref:VIP36-like protein n=1 Tax=Brachionichthys hirsutus TaxID=412623 RepID=UPI0036047580
MVSAERESSPDRSGSAGFGWRSSRKLLCLLLAGCSLAGRSVADEQDFLKQEYSLVKPYRGLSFSSSSHWDLMGTAVVTPDYVRLTPDLQSRQGAVWSRTPLFLRDWELQVKFKIQGKDKKNFNGDGLALWLTKHRMQNGPVFGNMDQFVGLGIFVDTYPNADKKHDRAFPYVSVMLGNGTLSYDHDQDGRPTELGGCAAAARNSIHDSFLLVRYSRRRLTVMVDVDGKQQWKDCADIAGLRLPLGYFWGASSATGDLSDNHDIISMKLYQLTAEKMSEEEEEEEGEEPTLPSVEMTQFKVEVEEGGGSGVHFFFTVLFSILGLGVLAVVGLAVYARWKENRRKRFY